MKSWFSLNWKNVFLYQVQTTKLEFVCYSVLQGVRFLRARWKFPNWTKISFLNINAIANSRINTIYALKDVFCRKLMFLSNFFCMFKAMFPISVAKLQIRPKKTHLSQISKYAPGVAFLRAFCAHGRSHIFWHHRAVYSDIPFHFTEHWKFQSDHMNFNEVVDPK